MKVSKVSYILYKSKHSCIDVIAEKVVYESNGVILWLAVAQDPVDTGRKFNIHKTFRRRSGRLLNVLCTFDLRPVCTGEGVSWVFLFVTYIKVS